MFSQGDIGSHFYIVLEGDLSVVKELTMQQAKEAGLDLKNDPSVVVTTMRNKDWNITIYSTSNTKRLTASMRDKFLGRRKALLETKLVELQEQVTVLSSVEGDHDDFAKKMLDSRQNEIEATRKQVEEIVQRKNQHSSPVMDALKQNPEPEAASDKGSGMSFVSDDNVEHLEGNEEVVLKTLVQLSDGASFGEIALESASSKRTATVIANKETVLLTIERQEYNYVLKQFMEKRKEQDVFFLKGIPAFSIWTVQQLSVLRDFLALEKHKRDHSGGCHAKSVL